MSTILVGINSDQAFEWDKDRKILVLFGWVIAPICENLVFLIRHGNPNRTFVPKPVHSDIESALVGTSGDKSLKIGKDWFISLLAHGFITHDHLNNALFEDGSLRLTEVMIGSVMIPHLFIEDRTTPFYQLEWTD